MSLDGGLPQSGIATALQAHLGCVMLTQSFYFQDLAWINDRSNPWPRYVDKHADIRDMGFDDVIAWLDEHNCSIEKTTYTALCDPSLHPLYNATITFPSLDIRMLFKLTWLGE